MRTNSLSLFVAALVLSVAATAQTWQSDLTIANQQLAAADRYLQAAQSAKSDVSAVSLLQQARTAYALAKSLYDQVAQQIEEESARYRWSPRKFTDYGDSMRNARRADDGVSEATAVMMERMRTRGGAQFQR